MVLRKAISITFAFALFISVKATAQCGSTNIAAGKTVTTSSSTGGNAGSNITDGVPSSVWQPIYGAANYASINLGAQQTVCRVILKWRYYQAASNFKIQMTNDPATESSWVDIYSETNNNPTEEETTGPYNDWVQVNTVNITSTNNTNKQYIRIWVGTIEWASWRLAEFQVFKPTTNLLPTASITNPSGNSTIAVNTAITLTASAVDTDGTIAQVAFYNDITTTNILVGIAPQTTTGPYTYTWIPTVAGTYTITARATDNLEGTGNSSSKTITVTPAATGGWSLGGNSLPSDNSQTGNQFLGTSNDQPVIFKTLNSEKMRIGVDGKIFIGTKSFGNVSIPANTLLGVKGFIVAQGLKVTQNNWPDYVFDAKYKLLPLSELATYIRKYKHLPGLPSVKEVSKEGINVGDNQAMLLQKIEELTLYLLEQNKKIEELKKEIGNLKKNR